jgi:hypothetical protein
MVRSIGVLASAVAIVGCIGSDVVPDAAVEADAAPDAGEPIQTAQIDKTFWYAGFKVTLGKATYGPLKQVTITAKFDNESTESETFEAELVIQTPSNNFIADAGTQEDVPKVPGKSSGTGTLVIPVNRTPFSFAGSTLIVGRAASAQAKVPIEGGGTLVDLAPKPAPITGTVTAMTLTLTVKSADLRYDVLKTHEQLKVGKLSLNLGFSISFTSDLQDEYPFSGTNLTLRLPDGTVTGSEDAPVELLKTRTTLQDQSVRFTVNNPPTGKYALILTDDKVSQELAFTLP